MNKQMHEHWTLIGLCITNYWCNILFLIALLQICKNIYHKIVSYQPLKKAADIMLNDFSVDFSDDLA